MFQSFLHRRKLRNITIHHVGTVLQPKRDTSLLYPHQLLTNWHRKRWPVFPSLQLTFCVQTDLLSSTINTSLPPSNIIFPLLIFRNFLYLFSSLSMVLNMFHVGNLLLMAPFCYKKPFHGRPFYLLFTFNIIICLTPNLKKRINFIIRLNIQKGQIDGKILWLVVGASVLVLVID